MRHQISNHSSLRRLNFPFPSLKCVVSRRKKWPLVGWWCSQEPSFLPFPAVLLDYVPLHLPLRRGFWVSCGLEDPGSFAFSPNAEYALSDLIVHSCKLGRSDLCLDEVLQLNSGCLELLYRNEKG